MNETFFIHCPTEDMLDHIVDISIEAGLDSNTEWYKTKKAPVNVGKYEGELRWGFGQFSDKEKTYSEYVECLKEHKSCYVRLNNEYIAEIDRNNNIVKVGCQEIPYYTPFYQP